jgi:hypothetical protein
MKNRRERRETEREREREKERESVCVKEQRTSERVDDHRTISSKEIQGWLMGGWGMAWCGMK